MTIEITQVDAFTDAPFAGNPAAVCVLEEMPEADWMQRIAAEMNLSETAFLVRRQADFDLRWFSPTTEVDLCGHATLASAHHLWESGLLAPHEAARFQTRSGTLSARRDGAWIELDFPACLPEAAKAPAALVAAMGAAPLRVARYEDNWLLEYMDEPCVRGLRPDFAALRDQSACVIATAASSGEPYDFVSRYFAPVYGIDEDPVTGSTHCTLGPWWQKRLGRDTFTAYQASHRGGVVRVRLEGDRVHLGGQAVTVLRATLTEPAAAGSRGVVTV